MKHGSFCAKSVNWNGLGVALVNLIRDHNFGINITKDIPPDFIKIGFLR